MINVAVGEDYAVDLLWGVGEGAVPLEGVAALTLIQAAVQEDALAVHFE
jgi:hypothetical protein